MCSIPLVIMGAGMLFQAVQQVQTANLQAKSLEQAAQINQQNADIARKQAQSVEYQGRNQRRDMQINAIRDKAKGIAAMAESGVAIDSGSALDWEMDFNRGLALDLRDSRYNTELKKHGINVEATNYENKAVAGFAEAKNVRSAGVMNAAGSLVGNAMSYGAKYYSPKSVGAGKSAIPGLNANVTGAQNVWDKYYA